MSDVTTDLLDTHVRTLDAAGVASPQVDVRLLAAHALDVPPRRVDAALREATAEQLVRLSDLVALRSQRVPVQHLTGRAPFRYLELEVRPGVFVPRPETEVLVGTVLDLLRSDRRTGPRIVVEPCTGTGAAALALAVEQPDVHVVACDVDPAAVALACWNLARVRRGEAGVDGLGEGSSVQVLEGDLLDAVDDELRGEVDVLACNPPYLPIADLDTVEPEVAAHDPHRALFGGPDGLEVVQRLLALAPSWLSTGGHVVLEIDDRRGEDVLHLAAAAGLVEGRLVRDLTGRDRILVARTPGGRW